MLICLGVCLVAKVRSGARFMVLDSAAGLVGSTCLHAGCAR